MYYCKIPNSITIYDNEVVQLTRGYVARNEIKERKITNLIMYTVARSCGMQRGI
jgi:hypothetical protein